MFGGAAMALAYDARSSNRGAPSVVDRPKLGFPTPTAQWLRGELAGWAHEILSSSAAGDLINLDFAEQMLAQHQSGEADLPASCGPS